MSENFRERTPWPIWLWLFLLFLGSTLSIAFWAALGLRWAAITALLQFLGLIYLSQRSLLDIAVNGQQLTVNKARIDKQFLGSVEILDSEQMRQWRGPLSDPACFMELRFWISTGVKIEILDPKDLTPYWLISSKKAQSLTTALLKEEE